MSHPRRSATRRRASGQSMVEFALVSPLFFFVVLMSLNAGTLMFSINAADHSARVGMQLLAAEGNVSPNPPPATPDTDAITALEAQGLGSTGLATIDEIDITKLDLSGSTFTPDSTYYNQYLPNGTALHLGWPPSSRIVTLAPPGPDYVQLTIQYHFSYFAFITNQAHLSVVRQFRLEPQA